MITARNNAILSLLLFFFFCFPSYHANYNRGNGTDIGSYIKPNSPMRAVAREKKQYIKGECVYVYTCVRAWVVRCVNYFQYGTLGDGEPGLLPASKLCTEDGGGEGDAICEVG